MSIETVKAKLQKALERLEEVIVGKVTTLEFENKKLRAEILTLKNQLSSGNQTNLTMPTTRKKVVTKEEKNNGPEQPPLLNPQVASDIDLTLSKLKKLVG